MSTTASTCQHDHPHAHKHGDTRKGHVHEAGTSNTVLSVPNMCCPTDGMVERSVILIEQMDCPTEEALIRKRLGSADGVASMSFNLMQRRLTVDHAPGQLPNVLKALQEIGLGGSLLGRRKSSRPHRKGTLQVTGS